MSSSVDYTCHSLSATLRGWFTYFRHCHRNVYQDLNGWIRMRLRSILRRRAGLSGRGRGADHYRWPNVYFHERGLYSLVQAHARLWQSSRRSYHRPERRMREIRMSGLEGGRPGDRSLLPLSLCRETCARVLKSPWLSNGGIMAPPSQRILIDYTRVRTCGETGTPSFIPGKGNPALSDEVPAGAGSCALFRGAMHQPGNGFPLDSLGDWLGVPISTPISRGSARSKYATEKATSTVEMTGARPRGSKTGCVPYRRKSGYDPRSPAMPTLDATAR